MPTAARARVHRGARRRARGTAPRCARPSARSSVASSQFTATSTGRTPTATAPRRRMGYARAEVGRPIDERSRVGRRAATVRAGRRRRRGTRESRAWCRPVREARARRRPRRRASLAGERDERHDVERTDARVHAGVTTRGRRAPPPPARVVARRSVSPSGPGEGEHRAMVVGVDVHVEQRVAARRARALEPQPIASLRHVGNALEHGAGYGLPRPDHAGRVPPVRIGWRCRSTTTRSAGESPLRWATVVGVRGSRPNASATTRCGSPTISSSTSRSTAAPPTRRPRSIRSSPSAALAGIVPGPGSERWCCARRSGPRRSWRSRSPSLDRICGGRLDVGIGAGWYEPEYAAIGMAMPTPGGAPGAAAAKRSRSCGVCSAGARSPSTGATTARSRRVNDPAAVQQPRAADHGRGEGRPAALRRWPSCADGWNTCWVWTPDAYRERLDVLERGVRRRSAAIRRTRHPLGRPLRALWRRRARPRAPLRTPARAQPARGARSTTLDEWRVGRLVGTVEQIREQAPGGTASGSRRSSWVRARCRSR